MLTAQWQAALMSQVRPASIVSKAPCLTSSDGASSVRRAVQVVGAADAHRVEAGPATWKM